MSVPAPKPRRLIVRDSCGEQLVHDACGRPIKHFQIDLTAVPHANSRAGMTAVVQEQCNLGCWHDQTTMDLPCWGAD